MISEFSFEEISFVIPIKIDSQDRLENLNFICNYLINRYINSQIIIVECDKASTLSCFAEKLELEYYFLNSERFSKTRAINLGLIKSNKTLICIWDADMIASPSAISQGIGILQKGNINLVIPHNQIFVNIKNELRNDFLQNFKDGVSYFHSINKFSKNSSNENIDIYKCHGGFILTLKSTLQSVGGFNYLMTSYGWEDSEILLRFKKLGLNYCFIKDYSAIHLDHFRGEDSKIGDFYEQNFSEYNRVKSKSYTELFSYSTSTLKYGLNIKSDVNDDFRKLNFLSRVFKLMIFYKHYIYFLYSVFGFNYFIKRFFKTL